MSAHDSEHPFDLAREETMARLLRLGGVRPDVPPERETRVRRAFLEEARAVSRARLVRGRVVGAAVALAVAAVAIVAVRVGVPREVAAPVVVVATIERLEGDAARQSGEGAPLPIALGDAVGLGDRIETGASARLGVRLADGASLRFDRGSRARLVSADRIELDAGAVYVDSGLDASGLEIVTSLGRIRDIGTQFEIRLDRASVRVRVRSGVVELRHGDDVSTARPGTELTLSPQGIVSRVVAPYGEEWAWTTRVGPEFEIEGRPLSAFLEHVCREQGWTLIYADPKLALDASGIMLHGSTTGLPASDALAIVLATTGLTHRLEDGELTVARVVGR